MGGLWSWLGVVVSISGAMGGSGSWAGGGRTSSTASWTLSTLLVQDALQIVDLSLQQSSQGTAVLKRKVYHKSFSRFLIRDLKDKTMDDKLQ